MMNVGIAEIALLALIGAVPLGIAVVVIVLVARRRKD